MPFEDDEKDLDEVGPEPRVKLKGQKPIVSPLNQARQFEGQAVEAHERAEGYKKRAAHLAKRYVEMMNDTVLIENKGIIAQNTEKQIVNDLAQLAVEMNNDETQDEGMGSVGLIVLLLKTAISQRNRINALEHKLSKFEKTSTPVQSRDLETARSDKK